MGTSEIVGSVAELWRFPVKSMGGELLQDADITERGVLGDRAYALVEPDTGKVVSAKSVRLYPELLKCKASFVEPPRDGGSMPPVRMTLPDGTTLRSDSSGLDRALSACFKRNVALRQSAPEDFTIDQYHPDVAGADPGGNKDTVVQQKLGSALFAAIGMDSPVPVGSFLDVFPMSVMTSSTLARLTELRPRTRFDSRRFRMNVVLKTQPVGFIENDWVGRAIGLGDAARLNLSLLDPRCVMTTLAQDDVPQDIEVLKTLVQHNRMQLGDLGKFPCAGIYAVVAAPGRVRSGDRVVLN
ncbi:MOSC domain-containing protein [Rhodoplanes sp. Z2-YC6860]|uniref:MOSC domain-containing protein n=1 Tax=Rhodoplanes sp. Z2-YC6860 TaxID=674703 RepID=UPI00082DA435|nr:MOSC N-terminal beta barrel domain-containing protein [Rhodoplanes sp. Z2-YC6860]